MSVISLRNYGAKKKARSSEVICCLEPLTVSKATIAFMCLT